VYFFPGNHDIWTYSYFEELGMTKLAQPCKVEIGGKVFCLGHGDGLGPTPLGYRFIKTIFNNRLLQILFSMIHPWFAYRLGNVWSRNSRLSHHEQYVFKGAGEPLYQFAEGYPDKVDYFIFGHFHAQADVTLPGGSRLLLLKDWMDSSPFICFDGKEIITDNNK
jgi:UDP-2,3-diacylglucosamine hydrolase